MTARLSPPPSYLLDDDRPEWRLRLECDDPEVFIAWMEAETRLLDRLDREDADPFGGLG